MMIEPDIHPDIHPDWDQFIKCYDQSMAQVIWTRLVSDLETPISAFLKLTGTGSHSFLFESVEGGSVRGRYSIIGMDPDLIWRTNGARAEINLQPDIAPDRFEPCPEPCLDSLRQLITASRIDLPETLPPMAVGVFGYLGYDMARQMEDMHAAPMDVLHIPDAILIRPRAILIFDSLKDESVAIVTVRPAKGIDARTAYDQAVGRLTRVVKTLGQPLRETAHAHAAGTSDQRTSDQRTSDQRKHRAIAIKSNMTKEAYMDKVVRAKEHIAAGDIFQVTVSQRFEAPFELPPFALYRALRRTNPAPFLYFLEFGDFAIAGSSPEILVRVRDGQVNIRPLAGTRPRGSTQAEDKANADSLLADPKERAEHLMLLDLGRNDVGRVSDIGSVRVTEQFCLEYYSHVMHIVSNVVGKLSPDHDPLDALVAGFPAGTVTGAPKLRAMRIIDELETEKRGPYAGCVGYFTADGAMDTCIMLRTAIIKNGKMYVQAGAGIVADSVPDSEHLECVNKARALFHAAEEAIRFSGECGHTRPESEEQTC